ncbi:MAG TPA: glycosyltransferase family 4 protein [Segetibacter sp.]|nr:glycosyltransferase family 4 protein [Segetibacter sp.]
MKIAQVAPLSESVPPKFYGGTERVVHYLTEELVKEGHKVTLFASGDSCTTATLIATVKKALRLNPLSEDTLAPHIVQIEDVIERQHQFDIIHFHTDYLHFPFSQNSSVAHLTTLHGKLSIPELQSVYNKFNQPVVSISDSQRKPLPQANFVGTVYHGLPENLHKKGNGDGGYVAFLGRISPEKGIDKAIEWAIAANVPLKIAAKVDKVDQLYFKTEIEPLFNHPLIEYIGEINESQKTEFLGKAQALLFPINWSEPFGMVMIEAMSCGAPIIAHGKGSVPEIIEEGKNGFIVTSTKEAVATIQRLKEVDRNVVREIFEQRFTAERMAKDYVEIYKKLVESKSIDKHSTVGQSIK